ncbi:uncharacterized protein METZ01_LOCUS434775 [marine metagenome]|uniref:Uncharacterized protein n=1 Tax=marine metagenome TaxID=408172 RepID=A0A382YG83_9ZZZZ
MTALNDLRVLGKQIRHRPIVPEIVVAVRDQWLATTHLGYTSLMRTLVATLTALMLFATTPVVAGDFWEGVVAYNAGDYQKALRLWKPVAEQGNKFAQSMPGVERTE